MLKDAHLSSTRKVMGLEHALVRQKVRKCTEITLYYQTAEVLQLTLLGRIGAGRHLGRMPVALDFHYDFLDKIPLNEDLKIFGFPCR